jgi:hypothetical protein
MKYIKLFEEYTETIYNEYDFVGMQAQKLGMTREEFTAHYATATIGSGIDEAQAFSAKGKKFKVKGIRFTYIERNDKFYGTSLFDVAKTSNVGKAAKLTLEETNLFLKNIGIKEEAPYKYNEKELDVICKQLTKKGIVCDYDDAMDI